MGRTLIISAALLALAGCAPGIVKSDFSPSQYWRPADSADSVKIEGAIAKVSDGWVSTSHALYVRFNGDVILRGHLRPDLSGDVSGGIWNGKPVSASCSSRRQNERTIDVACMVFVGNERTVTLSF